MKIIKADVEFVTPIDGAVILSALNNVGGFATNRKIRSLTPAPRRLWPVLSIGAMKLFWNTVPSQ